MSAPALARKAFSVSRLAEFASVSELTRQTGQPPRNWPLTIVKELVDNALDAAEEAGVAPEIHVTVAGNGEITVTDQGPGLPAKTVASLIDYTKRTSSRAAYVSPSRGAQGNALQTLVAMPYVLDGQSGETVIESRGVKHSIIFTVDPLRQTPKIEHVKSPSAIKKGARVTVGSSERACSLVEAAKVEILSLLGDYAWLNPHLHLSGEWVDDPNRTFAVPTDPEWRKWRPNMPTSPHWYDAPRLFRLIAATVAHAEDTRQPCPSLRDFVRDFRGLSSTVKAAEIAANVGGSGMSLADFHRRGQSAAMLLLGAMRGLSRPVPPRELGVIGKEHLVEMAVTTAAAGESSFQYRQAAFEHDGLPYVIETAFAMRKKDGVILVEGFNFTPAVGDSPFQLGVKLAQQMVESGDPVVAFAHVVSPRLEFLDRGKARVALPFEVAAKLNEMVGAVSAAWRKQRKAEERHSNAINRRYDAMTKRDKPKSIKEAAYEVMEAAYLKASKDGTLPANARQIYYAARGDILAITGKDALDSGYFTQTLLVDYIEENGCDWDVVFDARGRFSEPHGGASVDLGTLEVRSYLALVGKPQIREASVVGASVGLYGPSGRYKAALFVEKEGFDPLLARAQIADRFDVAIMSTKGMSVTAARQLVDGLAGRGVRLFVLHDFDISGFSIKKTLTTSGRRHQFKNKLDFVDLGLRLADVERLSLQSERVGIVAAKREAIRKRLVINGATAEERNFLLDGQRVELNAMPSDMFVQFIEDGLRANGVTKVIPDVALLTETYTAMKRGAAAKAALQAELERLNAETVATPPRLAARVRAYVVAHPTASWVTAVAAVAVGRDEAEV